MTQAVEAKDAAILGALSELALIYYRPDFGPAESKAVLRQYLDDLREFAVKDILHAVQAYRRNPENNFFPHPGALRGLIATPPAWWATGQAAWMKDCRVTAEHELNVKIRAIEGAQQKRLTG